MTQSSTTTNIKAPFDSLTLRAVVAELRARLIGGQVQDIRQPSATELRLGIRSQGRNQILALSCDARFARVHLTSHKPPNAAVPPSFCMAIRKHCEGAVVRDIRQRGFDRIIEIEIGTRSSEADTSTTVLVAELMGKHSNLILVSATGAVLEAAKRISHRINRFREVLPGLPYLPPPPEQGDKLDPFAAGTVEAVASVLSVSPPVDAKECAVWLVERVAGMSPFLAQNVAMQLFQEDSDLSARLPQVWKAVFGAADRGEFRPVAIVVAERAVSAYPFPSAQIPVELQMPVPELNAALDAAYSGAVVRAGSSAIASELRGQIDKDRKRLQRQQEIAERAIREADRAEEYKQCGELVLANLWQIQPGATTITVQDYFDSDLGERTIALDPKLSPQENADALFRRYRKIRDGQVTAETRRVEAAALLVPLEVARAKLKEWEESEKGTEAEIRQLRDELKGRGLLVQHGAPEEGAAPGPDLQGHKIRRLTSPEGYEILIGETATANDYLTLRLAASNDLWLHVRASTSAHVIIKTHGRPEAVPRSVIEYAALLCARHSSQKHSGLVPVDYTLKKHVRKPRGAAPGSADYHHETTLHITPDKP